MKLYESEEGIAKSKQEFSEWATSGFKGVDEEMIPLLKKFNAIEGVVTRHCCASHPENKRFRFYIQFAVTERGHRILEAMFQSLRYKLADKEINTTNLSYCGVGYSLSLHAFGPTAVFSIECNTIPKKKMLFKLLETLF